ncbi:MAG: diaminopropionate ammonia-lyase [Candidatus Zixiibacteriota bacterium]
MAVAVVNRYRQPSPGWSEAVEAPFRADDITALHHSIPEYKPTPLVHLPGLVSELGVGGLVVKDEAHRFGLKAFKALGASYAIYRYVKAYLAGQSLPCPAPSEFYSWRDILRKGELTLCTATDGNHGRGVAWTARKLDQGAVIYMPNNSAPARVQNIRGENAKVVLVDGTYDDAVTRCARDAAVNRWQTVSDTSWTGYEEIPRWIMAGYLTLFREIENDIGQNVRIDLVLVQGGVGALAAAAAWYFRRESPWPQVTLVSVEPTEAACLLESISSPSGEPVLSRGRQNSIMAGLNCGTPSLVAWPLIKLGFDMFLAIDDSSCVDAMRRFYHPSGNDTRVISGESGAAGLAALLSLTGDSSLEHVRRSLPLTPDSTVLLLNTEGDTDPDGFRSRVGKNKL